MIFAYDPQRQKYLPANGRFRSHALRQARADIKKLKEMVAEPAADRDLVASDYYLFEALLSYIYAGKEKQGWKLCRQFGGCGYWRRKVRRTLKTDALYHSIYSRKKRHR